MTTRIDFDGISAGRKGGGGCELAERVGFHGTRGEAGSINNLNDSSFDEFAGWIGSNANNEIGPLGA